MSKQTRNFLDSIESAGVPQSSVGAAQGGIAAFLSAAKDAGGKIWDSAAPAVAHGNAEAASLLFRGDGYVMYGHGPGGNRQDQPDHGLPAIEAVKQPEVQKEQDQGIEI